jgi:tetratricopeptide (TPR) repeat protein
MLRPLLRIALVTAVAVPGLLAQTPAPAGVPRPPAPIAPSTPALLTEEANAFYRTRNFDSARQKYQQLIQENPKLPGAYAGLTRVYLKQKNVPLAFETISKGLQIADSPSVRVALGEVYFRQGKIAEAEHEWVDVINSGYRDARAYLGIARVSYAISMHKRAKAMVYQAHELDPTDSDVQRYWIATLKTADRIKFLRDYLSRASSDDVSSRERLQRQLGYLLARAQGPKRGCRLVSTIASTETNLIRLLHDPRHIRGYGLPVVVNGEKSELLLDTGASGILIDRRVAEKAGLTKLSETRIGGIGDKGESNGYMAVANSIKIGQLEFQNCPVEVLDKRSVLFDDGLIGGDVFDDFLVDIDFPKEKLRLTELPKRPEDAGRTIGLQADSDSDASDEKPQESNSAAGAKPSPAQSGPQDRYIAPEMKSYTQIFRFGHMLLVPTGVGAAPFKLFLLDTGAFGNSISPEAAREVTKVHGDPNMYVKGLSGSVKNVYTADKAVIRFGHLRQPNEDIVTFDLSSVSDSAGTEVSGTLGFKTLSLLDIKIDYRDGLVDFTYKP